MAESSTSSTHCRDLMDVYGNFQPTSVKSTILTEFTVDIKSLTKPNFIHESNFGVTDVRVTLTRKTVAGKTYSFFTTYINMQVLISVSKYNNFLKRNYFFRVLKNYL